MKKFRQHWDQPKVWGPTDIVCYYRWLYHAKFGVLPEIDWTICCGAASRLLKKLGSPQHVRHYLQVAFYITRFRPQGLNSLYHSTVYEQVRQNWDLDEDKIDDYEDDYVFPWCREIRSQLAHKQNAEYQQRLARMYSSPHWQKRMEEERRRKSIETQIRFMQSHWNLYSEIGKAY